LIKNEKSILQILNKRNWKEEKMTKEELEAQLTIKIINCIKFHLCKQDEDYDKPIISPKFLSDALDQMAMDGFKIG
jgi:hypothetical protein